MTIDRLREIYDDYLFDMNVCESERDLRSALNNIILGSNGSDACNIRFAQKVEKALAGFDFETEDAEELMDFMLCKAVEYRDSFSIALMLRAVQKFLVPFAEHISPEKAKAVLGWYDAAFEKRDRTPVMVAFRKALKKRSE